MRTPQCCEKCWKNERHLATCSCRGEGSNPAKCADSNCFCHTPQSIEQIVEAFRKLIYLRPASVEDARAIWEQAQVLLSTYGAAREAKGFNDGRDTTVSFLRDTAIVGTPVDDPKRLGYYVSGTDFGFAEKLEIAALTPPPQTDKPTHHGYRDTQSNDLADDFDKPTDA